MNTQKSFLVIDTYRLSFSFRARYVASKGHSAHLETDPDAALQWLHAGNKCDAIVMDILFGNSLRVDLLRKIRSDFRQLLIILFSSVPFSSDLVGSDAADYYFNRGSSGFKVFDHALRLLKERQT